MCSVEGADGAVARWSSTAAAAVADAVSRIREDAPADAAVARARSEASGLRVRGDGEDGEGLPSAVDGGGAAASPVRGARPRRLTAYVVADPLGGESDGGGGESDASSISTRAVAMSSGARAAEAGARVPLPAGRATGASAGGAGAVKCQNAAGAAGVARSLVRAAPRRAADFRHLFSDVAESASVGAASRDGSSVNLSSVSDDDRAVGAGGGVATVLAAPWRAAASGRLFMDEVGRARVCRARAHYAFVAG